MQICLCPYLLKNNRHCKTYIFLRKHYTTHKSPSSWSLNFLQKICVYIYKTNIKVNLACILNNSFWHQLWSGAIKKNWHFLRKEDEWSRWTQIERKFVECTQIIRCAKILPYVYNRDNTCSFRKKTFVEYLPCRIQNTITFFNKEYMLVC